MKLRLSPRADQDIDNIYERIGEHDPLAAARHVDEILHSLDLALEQPLMGRLGTKPGTRELVVLKRYIVVYRAAEGALDVVRVFDGREDWQHKL